jgi:glycerate 2-kinase
VRAQVNVRNKQLFANGFAISLSRFKRIMLLAVGKASAPMLVAVSDILTGFDVYGVLVAPRNEAVGVADERIEVFRSDHPVPDRQGMIAAQHVIDALSRMRREELLICLISGGASAMLPAPPDGISLADLRKLTTQLIMSKATIHEINTVRRHVSKLNGGRLVKLCRASKILSLIISDVPGDPLPDIASGLTVEDPSSYEDAVEVLKSHYLWASIPKSARDHLSRGVRHRIPDSPKPGDQAFLRVHNLIIAGNRTACIAARRSLTAKKVTSVILSSSAEMDAQDMGRFLASLATEHERSNGSVPKAEAFIMGGETTVEVKGRGMGGRNQETALWAVDKIAGLEGVAIAALGTDGIDGSSTAAGALTDGDSARRASEKRMDPPKFLSRNDSYDFFRRLGDNIITGPTGTNVGDLYLMVAYE